LYQLKKLRLGALEAPQMVLPLGILKILRQPARSKLSF